MTETAGLTAPPTRPSRGRWRRGHAHPTFTLDVGSRGGLRGAHLNPCSLTMEATGLSPGPRGASEAPDLGFVASQRDEVDFPMLGYVPACRSRPGLNDRELPHHAVVLELEDLTVQDERMFSGGRLRPGRWPYLSI